jgi:quercetin dioxygenase-like cupin family protein
MDKDDMAFIKEEELPKLELFPKAFSGIVAGEGIMLSFLDLQPGCEIPEHSHPHEQAGFVLQGSFRFRIGSEERLTGPGDAFIVPPDVVHSGEVVEGPVRIVDIFSPPREDYLEKYNLFKETTSSTRWE